MLQCKASKVVRPLDEPSGLQSIVSRRTDKLSFKFNV